MQNNNVVALVPMRHESERVPKKNYRSFNGLPLYHHIINTLLECKLISSIYIDTDSPYIKEDAAKNFPDVNLIDRAKQLIGGDIPTNEILLNDIDQIKSEYFLQTHCTNPLLSSNTVTKAINLFFEKLPEHDSLFAVTNIQSRFWDKNTKPINHDPALLLRTQDLAPIYEENSNIYIFSREGIQSSRNRIGKKPYMFEIDRLEAWDIDEELDFQIAEKLHKMKRKERN